MTALVLAGALSGCSEDTQAKPLPPLPSATPTVAAAPSPPPEAMAETAQGASAFTKYYFGVLINAAYASKDTAQVAALSAPECGSCANVVEDIERLERAGLSVDGQRFKLAFAEAPPADSDGTIVVDFRYTSDPYVETDGAGKVVRRLPAQVEQDAQVKLGRSANAWVVLAIRTL